MRVSTVTTGEELHRLRDGWEEALRRAGHPSPFLAFDWIVTWWEHFGSRRQLLTLVAEDDEGIAGLAALAISRYRLKGVPLRALEFIGAPFRGPCLAGSVDLVIVRRHAECASAFAERLQTEARRWDLMCLRNVPVESGNVAQLGEAAGPSLSLRCARTSIVPVIRAGSWEEYLASRRHSFRRSLRKWAQEAQQAGLGPVRRLTDPDEVAAVLPEMARVYGASWKGSDRGDGPGPRYLPEGFLGAVLPRLCARGGAVLNTLAAQDRMVAYELAFRSPEALWLYDTAYDQRYADASPGANVLMVMIESGLRSHLTLIDMGPGVQEYKVRWATEYARRAHWLGFHGGVRSRALALAARAAEAWRGRTRPAAPEKARA